MTIWSKAIWGLLFLVSLALVSCGSDKIQDIKTQLEVVEKARSFNDFNTAIAAMHQVIQLDPNQYAYLDTLASLYYLAGKMESAYRASTKALTYQILPNTLYIASEASRATGRSEEALEYTKRIEESAPGDVAVKYNIGLDNANLGNAAEAISYFQKVTQHPKAEEVTFEQYTGNGSQVVPYLAAAHNSLGYIYMQQGEADAAAEQFQMALKVFPEYALAKNNLQYLIQAVQQTK